MSNQIKVSNLSTITKGKKVTIDLDVGFKYLAVHIKRTAFTAAEALSFVMKVNGKPRWNFDTLQQIEDVNTHYNRPQVAGFTTLYFNRPELADSEDRDLTGLGTADIQSCQLEFLLDAAIVGTPDIEVVADVANLNENIGWITHYETSDIALTKIGKNTISKMPVGNGNVFAYFLGKPTDNITDLQMFRTIDGAKSNVIDSTKEFLVVQQKQAPMKPRVPVVASWTVLDFTTSGVPEDALQTEYVRVPGSEELEPVERVSLEVYAATAETLTVITESVGDFRG